MTGTAVEYTVTEYEGADTQRGGQTSKHGLQDAQRAPGFFPYSVLRTQYSVLIVPRSVRIYATVLPPSTGKHTPVT